MSKVCPCSGIVRCQGDEHCRHGFYVAPACQRAGDGKLDGLPCCNERLAQSFLNEAGKPELEWYANRAAKEYTMETQWNEYESAPKDGTEILICLPRQPKCYLLVSFNRTYGYWQSKGKPELSLAFQAFKWMPLPNWPVEEG